VCSNDTIAIVKDTQKEDSEKALVKGWEDREAGRVDTAKAARELYMLKSRRRNGEELSEEDIERLGQVRVSKKKAEEGGGG
jgi:hypothetical protein